jgi:hypothetical protein
LVSFFVKNSGGTIKLVGLIITLGVADYLQPAFSFSLSWKTEDECSGATPNESADTPNGLSKGLKNPAVGLNEMDC